MPTILEEIVASKRVEVEEQKRRESLDDLQSKIARAGRARNFYSAITKTPVRKVNLIAEIKKASPSAGVIRDDFDPKEIAKIYTESGADAISVLTDEKYFQGRLEYIQQVREVTNLPVLRKDFIIEDYQIYQSRAYGADAILLIAEILTPGQILDMLILASSMHMTSLIEVHGADNLLQVRKTVGFPHKRYSLLGINNRDLHVQKTDVGNTMRLASLLDEEDCERLVSESGIRTAGDIDKLVSVGVRGVLIGETILRSDDICGKIEELLGPKK